MIRFGFLTAAELIDTLSAPFLSNTFASFRDETPPPTVKGISRASATLKTRSERVFLFCSVAEISKKTNSSAPSAVYLFANSTGSPASIKLIKFTPLTVLPFLISKQGIILFAIIS